MDKHSNNIVNRYIILEKFYTHAFFHSNKFVVACLHCGKEESLTFKEMLNKPECNCE